MRKTTNRIIAAACALAIYTLSCGNIDAFASVGANATLNSIVEGDGEQEPLEGMKALPDSLSCTFVVPEGFGTTDTPGFYTNEFYPLESANVTYSVSYIPQDRVLTNAEKAAGESPSMEHAEYRYDELTADMYEEIQKTNYLNIYGENTEFILESFENREFDGFPGYFIKTTFTPENSQRIHQITVIVLSKNKIYTIVYSRAEDDDFEEVFNKSMESIHVM